MQKSPIFYVAIGFILAFFLVGILVMLVPQLRPAAFLRITGAETYCYDGIDNDGNGLVDMDDPGCLGGGGTESVPPSGYPDGESPMSTSMCGDGNCDADEDSASCPSDCESPSGDLDGESP